MSAGNLREFSRVEVHVGVEVARPGLPLFKAVAQDVSLNGVRIRSSEVFKADTRCDVRLILGESEPVIIQACGCAIRSDGEYVAIHFDELELEGYSHLKNLILYNALDSDQIEQEFDAHIGLHRKDI